VKCPACQHENRPGAKFCEECAAALSRACPNCGSALSDSAKFCPECAHPLTAASVQTRFASPKSYTPKHLAERILTSKSALEGERKQVTVLFCDVAGSTALAERLGADAMHGVLNAFFELALAEIHRYEGTINQFLGDGFMALFGAPVAHEDHARRAALAALALHRALRERGVETEAGDTGPIDVRMGLNTGLVVVGKIGDDLRMDYTAVGDTTNVAARLQQLAEPGAICLSQATYRLVEPYIDCEALGERKLKGKTEPVTVYAIVGTRVRAGSGRREISSIGSPLVGRDREMATLTGCLERLLAGQGGIVGLLGEAGLGKSRLMTEASRTVADRGILWLEGRALSFGQTLSYWPFLQILRAWAGITEEDSDAEGRRKLERQVRELFPDEIADILPYLATLLGVSVGPDLEHRVKYLDGQAMGRQIFRTARHLFERLAQANPVVLIFEDLHWADQSSTELIEHLFPLVETVPLLLCGVGRTERDSPAARLRAIARASYVACYTEIVLAPLSSAASTTLVANLLAGGQVPARLEELILRKTEGNPFFVEEVIRSLVTAGTLASDATGQWRVSREIGEVTIPDTLHGVIMARVDRLDEDVKLVLKIASVIGRSFFYRVLVVITAAGLDLDESLDELQQLEMIREKRRSPELEYFFKHALVQEATYGSILLDRRRALHRRVGESIERLFADRLEEFPGLLAYHYSRAEDWEKAQHYLLEAGDQAGRIAADAEALAHYQDAMKVYAKAFGDRCEPMQRANIESKIGEALFRRGEHTLAAEYSLRALSYLGAPYPASRAGVRLRVLVEITRQALHRLLPRVLVARLRAADPYVSERHRAYETMSWIDYFVDQERLFLDAILTLNFSERMGFGLGIVHGAGLIGLICDLLGLPRLALTYHKRAVGLAEEIEHPSALGDAYFVLAMHEYFLGQWDLALQHFRRAATGYRNAGDLHRAAAPEALIFHVMLHCGEFEAARIQAGAHIRVGEDTADAQVRAWGLQELGDVEMATGHLEKATSNLRRAIELFRAIPDHGGLTETMADLGQCLLRQGNLEEALTWLEQSNRLIAERRLRSHQVVQPKNGLAEAYLLVALQGGPDAPQQLRRAGRACRDALRTSRHFHDGLPEALRLTGTWLWLTGRAEAARRRWRESLNVAENLGARWDLGLTHLEVGRRTGDQDELKRGDSILAEIGATVETSARDRPLTHG